MATRTLQAADKPELIAECASDELMDVEVQNLSANVVYLGDSSVNSTNFDTYLGAVTGVYTVYHRKNPVYAVSGTAGTTIQVRYETYKARSRGYP